MGTIQGRFSQVNSNASFTGQSSMMPRLQTSVNSGEMNTNSAMQQTSTNEEQAPSQAKAPSFKGEQPAPFDYQQQQARPPQQP